MTTLTIPAPQVSVFDSPGEEPINLFQLGALFVIRTSYWPCRVSNEPADLELSPERIDAQAIASFGTKDLVDPEQGRKVFQTIEKKARHSRPFATAGAHFVPWQHATNLVDQLEQIKAEFDQAVETFVQEYPQLRAEWQAAHADIPETAISHEINTGQGGNFVLKGLSIYSCKTSRKGVLPYRYPSRKFLPDLVLFWP